MHYADKPIQLPKDDRLERGRFVKRLADDLLKIEPTASLTFGLYGEWGSGKSSVLKLLQAELEARTDPPVVVWFEPWFFHGEAALLTNFAETLGRGLGEFDHVAAELVRRLPALVAGMGAALGHPWLQTMVNHLGCLKPRTLDDTYKQLKERLAKAKRRVIVLVDDLDRLEPDDMRAVVKYLRLVGDLPGVIYVAAFDPRIVAAGLGRALGGGADDGEAYLAKIVQVTRRLPPAETLRELLVKRVCDGLEPADRERVEKVLNQAWDRALHRRVATPRAVYRLANALYTPTLAEMPTEIIAAHALALFYPDVFALIEHLPRLVTIGPRPLAAPLGPPETDAASDAASQARERVDDAIESRYGGEEPEVLFLLQCMWPDIPAFWGAAPADDVGSTPPDERWPHSLVAGVLPRRRVLQGLGPASARAGRLNSESAAREALDGLFAESEQGDVVAAVERLMRLDPNQVKDAFVAACLRHPRLGKLVLGGVIAWSARMGDKALEPVLRLVERPTPVTLAVAVVAAVAGPRERPGRLVVGWNELCNAVWPRLATELDFGEPAAHYGDSPDDRGRFVDDLVRIAELGGRNIADLYDQLAAKPAPFEAFLALREADSAAGAQCPLVVEHRRRKAQAAGG